MDEKEEFRIVQGKYVHFSHVEKFIPGLNRWKVLQYKGDFPEIIKTINENGKTYTDMVDILLARQVAGYDPKIRRKPPGKSREKKELKIFSKKILNKYPDYAREIEAAIGSGKICYSRLDEICDEISENSGEKNGENAISEISDLLFRYGVTVID